MINLFATRRNVLIKEADLMKAIKILDRRRISVVRISSCDGLEKGKWCISLRVTDTEFSIVEKAFGRENIRIY